MKNNLTNEPTVKPKITLDAKRIRVNYRLLEIVYTDSKDKNN